MKIDNWSISRQTNEHVCKIVNARRPAGKFYDTSVVIVLVEREDEKRSYITLTREELQIINQASEGKVYDIEEGDTEGVCECCGSKVDD